VQKSKALGKKAKLGVTSIAVANDTDKMFW